MSVLSFEEARRVVEREAARVTAPGSEQVPLQAALDRVLAQDVLADRDLPPFPRATRDGYAVRSSDVANPPARLKLKGEIRAGMSAEQFEIREGEAIEIMTGAPVPQGSDCVVMVEYTSREGNTVEIQRSALPGDNIVPKGAEARADQTLLARGTRLDYSAIAAAASVGCADPSVYHLPSVAILSTGDEIVEIGSSPAPHQIRNSNSYSLSAQVQDAGGEPMVLPVAPDDHTSLRLLIEQGFTSNLLLLTGGVSMGKYDLVEQVLTEFGAEFFFTGALIQPGKPVVFGRVREKYFFGLPGNPVSTMVTFELFVRPMVDALSGANPAPLPFAKAQLAGTVRSKTGLTRFLPAFLSDAKVDLVPWQGSGDVVSTARANCYLVIPPDRGHFEPGEFMTVLLR